MRRIAFLLIVWIVVSMSISGIQVQPTDHSSSTVTPASSSNGILSHANAVPINKLPPGWENTVSPVQESGQTHSEEQGQTASHTSGRTAASSDNIVQGSGIQQHTSETVHASLPSTTDSSTSQTASSTASAYLRSENAVAVNPDSVSSSTLLGADSAFLPQSGPLDAEDEYGNIYVVWQEYTAVGNHYTIWMNVYCQQALGTYCTGKAAPAWQTVYEVDSTHVHSDVAPDIAVSQTGTVCIAYSNSFATNIFVLCYVAGAWSTTAAYGASQLEDQPAIAFDQGGFLILAYADPTGATALCVAKLTVAATITGACVDYTAAQLNLAGSFTLDEWAISCLLTAATTCAVFYGGATSSANNAWGIYVIESANDFTTGISNGPFLIDSQTWSPTWLGGWFPLHSSLNIQDGGAACSITTPNCAIAYSYDTGALSPNDYVVRYAYSPDGWATLANIHIGNAPTTAGPISSAAIAIIGSSSPIISWNTSTDVYVTGSQSQAPSSGGWGTAWAIACSGAFMCMPGVADVSSGGSFNIGNSIPWRVDFVYPSASNAYYAYFYGPALNKPTATSTALDLGESTTISVTEFSAPPTAEGFTISPSTGYTWFSIPTGCASTANSFICTPTATGSFSVSVSGTDTGGFPSTAQDSLTIVVNSVLVAGTVTASTTTIDFGQSLSLSAGSPSGGTPTYTYQWMSGTALTCSGETAVPGQTTNAYSPSPTANTYYCVKYGDSSTASPAPIVYSNLVYVVVNPALSAGSVTPASPSIDSGQPVTLTSTLPTGGTSPYSLQWMSGTSSTCSGDTSVSGQTGTSYVPAPTTSTYYCVQYGDNSTGTPLASPDSNVVYVTVNPTLSAGAITPSAPSIDNGQSVTLTSHESGGTSIFSYQWYSASSPLALCTAGTLISSATSTTYLATPSVTTYYCYQVNDSSAAGPESVGSSWDLVTVNSALTAPTTPTVSATALDVNQALTVQSTLSSTGTPTYSWTWLVSVNGNAYVAATQCATNSGSGAAGGATETCSIAASTLISGDTYNFELQVTDSSSTPATATSGPSPTVTVYAALTAPTAPTVSATALDVNQPLTVQSTLASTGAPTYSWAWFVSINSGAWTAATQCAVNSGSGAAGGATETCAISASALTAGDFYSFELKVTDSATSPETQTSIISPAVTVSSALTAPSTPTVSAIALDVNQALTVQSTLTSTGTSPYAWAWLVSINSGAYAAATQCATNSGSGAAGGATETCSIAASTLTAGDTYNFELKVTDSATTPEAQTSSASFTVSVYTALTAPTAPAVSAASLDVNQALTVQSTLASTGAPTFSWVWLVSVNSGAYVATSLCVTSSGSGALAGATETCSIVANMLTAGDTYNFELKVTDSATTAETQTSGASPTVTVYAALAAGAVTPGSPIIDNGQSIGLTSHESGGAPGFSYQWYSSGSGTGLCNAGTLLTGATGPTYTPTPAATIYYCYQVTDSSGAGAESQGSAWDKVTVNSALAAPSTPTVSAIALDVDQALTVQSTLSSTGTPTYSWTWLISINSGAYVPTTQCAVNSGSGASGGSTETCTIAASTLTVGDTYKFELQVTDSAFSPETQTSGASSTVTVYAALTAPSVPTVSATTLDVNQALTVQSTLGSNGAPTYSWAWLISINSGAYATATQCAINSGSGAAGGATETCTINANLLTAGDTYNFELKVTDSATTAETKTSGASSTVTVNSALTAPSTPTVSAIALDVNQALTVQSTLTSTGTPTYSWTWLISINSGTYAAATQCATNNGSGASGGATETCAIAANTLTAGDTYNFELKVTDSATTAETQTSLASSTVTVYAALTAPSVPTVSATALDVNQALTVQSTLASTGAPTYSWAWLVSINSGAYAAATQCTVNSGSGAAGGATETCTINANLLTAGDTYNFELKVTDSATTTETQTSGASSTVTVYAALSAGAVTPTSPSIDSGQTITLTSHEGGGTPIFSYQWYSSASGTGACNAGTIIGSATASTYTTPALTQGTYYYCYQVTDSSGAGAESIGSTWDKVTVNMALSPSSIPTVSSTALDVDQALTVQASLPVDGTPTYSWVWLVSINSGAYAATTQCAVNSGSGAATGATETCSIAASTLTIGDTYNFELKITDSSVTPVSATSPASSTVTVYSALTAPSTPTVSSTVLDVNQVLTVQSTLSSNGAPTYSWAWLISINSGAYAAATQCAANSGSGAAGGATETCSIAANTLTVGDTYNFELKVTDSATTAETKTSLASSTVTVNSALTAPSTPTVSATALDVNQALTVQSTLTSTGTPTYSWAWLISINSGAYAAATQCTVNSGIGAAGGATETCSIAASTLTAGDTYNFELKVTDSATTAETQTSLASSTVTVYTALTAPSVPTVSATALDVNQALTVQSTLALTGAPTYSWVWLISINSGAYAAATQCTVNNGIGAAAGATEICSITASTLTAGDTYNFELKVTDSATTAETQTSGASSTVTVYAALSAGAVTPTSPSIDLGQSITLTSHESGGTPSFLYQWYSSATGSGACNAGTLLTGATSSTYSPSPAATIYYCYQVTDSSGAGAESIGSAWNPVTVNSALTAPSVPTVSAIVLDVDQALTVQSTLSSTGTPTYSWNWLVSVNDAPYVAATQCAVSSGSGATSGATETCAISASTLTVGDTYSFELKVTDSSAASPETQTSGPSSVVTVYTALTAPSVPTVSATALDVNQALTVQSTLGSNGAPTYSWAWLISINIGAYAAATQCTTNSGAGAAGGATETCSIAAGTLTAGDTYKFELQVTDSATTAETKTSGASSTVAVNSALNAASTPTISAIALDVNQALTVQSTLTSTGTPTYSWAWLISINSGAYTAATQCAANSGSGAAGGATETCSIAANTLTAGDTYNFELRVTDSATSAETQTSGASSTVTVYTALTPPSVPTVSATALDVNQALTVQSTLTSTGAPTYSWAWLVSINSGAYAAATQCATNSGSGAAGGATETCSIAAGTLTAGDTYNFEKKVTDSATSAETQTSGASSTVAVHTALTAPSVPTVSATALDVNQALTVQSTLTSTGAPTYSWAWLISINSGAYAAATQCAANSGSGAAGGATETCSIAASTLTAGDTYNFELKVTDSATSAETQTSGASSTVTVYAALSAGAVTPTSPSIDLGQSITFTSHESGGTPSFLYQWYSSATGSGACNAGTLLTGATSSTYSPSPAATIYYCYQVADSSGAGAESQGSVWDEVMVNSALTASSVPTVSATALDVDQALTVQSTLASTGTPTYSWVWMVSVSGAAYAAASQCSVNGGSGASGGATETCTIAANTLTATKTYNFELQITDNAFSPESQTSGASSTVTVYTALTASSAPTVSATALDVNQALTVQSILGSNGAPTYSWTWLVSVNSGAYVATTQCAANSGSGASGGATETCSIAANALTAGDTYKFELQVTDSATTAETKTSTVSSTVTVYTALTASTVPTVSVTALDVDQALTVQSTLSSTGTPSYSWAWQVSVNSAAYVATTQCATNSGSGASGGTTETCTIAANTLTAGDTYNFELKVTDSATSTETQTSGASSTVTVYTALTAPTAPTVSATALDVNEALTVQSTLASTGAPTYSWAWLISINSGAYAAATQCTTNSGAGAAGGATETCSIAASTLTAGDTYSFELKVTDSAGTPETKTSTASSTVTVYTALTASTVPTVSATALDVNQALTVQSTLASTGAPTYSWAWQISINSGGYAATTQCAVNSGFGAAGGATETCTIAASTLTAGDTYNFELKVTDSAGVPETQTSGSSATVTVNTALTASLAPTVSATALDVNQALTAQSTLASTGTSTYSWTWLMSVNSGAYAVATQCTVNGGSGAAGGAAETCSINANLLTAGDTYNFELKTTDSATTPETQTSGASPTVTMYAALTAGAVTPASPSIDSGQTVILTSHETGGTPTINYQWYSTAGSGACNAGTVISGATGASYTTPTLTTGTYYYCYQVTDSSGAGAESQGSAWDTVNVNSALTAPSVPTVSATALDVDQPLTVQSTLPSTGTPAYSWVWTVSVSGGAYAAATQCAINSGLGASGGATETCTIAANTLTATKTYNFELQITDSSVTPELQTSGASSTVTVYTALTASSLPTVSATALDVNQALTVQSTLSSNGAPTYSWAWLISINSGAYAAATQCATNGGSGAAGGTPETCSIAASTLTAGETYNFELKVTDSAGTPETKTSTASPTVTVYAALTASTVPTVSATALDVNQALTVQSTMASTGAPTYSWAWQISINSGGYAATTQCAVNSGSGAAGGATETCTIAASTLTAGDTYNFELKVTDSAGTPETQTSGASTTVTVYTALTTPSAPTVSATAQDVDQMLSTQSTLPSTGAPTYSWAWMISVDSGAYAAATQCAVNSGSGAAGGTTETCSIAANLLTAGDTYNFELKATDSATTPEMQTSGASPTVTINAALSAGAVTPAAPNIDSGQSIVLTSHEGGGTPTYSYEWYSNPASSGACNAGTNLASTSSTYTASPTSNTYYCYQVTDSSGAGVESIGSAWVEVTVNPDPSLTAVAEAAPFPCSSGCSGYAGVTLSVDTTASLGTGTYAFTWSITAGSAYCSGSASGATTSTYSCTVGALSATETWTITVFVTDSNGCKYPGPCAGGSTLSFTVTLYQDPSLTAVAETTPVACSSGCSADQGQTLSVVTTASLGSGGYTFTWAITAGSSFCSGSASGSTTSTYTCTVGTVSSTQTWTITVYVADSNGCRYPGPCSGGSPLSFTVSLYQDPSLSAITQTSPVSCSSGCSADQGQTLTVSTTPSLGSGGYAFTWAITAGAAYCSSSSTTSTYTCTIGALALTETWTITVYVTDSNGCKYPNPCGGGAGAVVSFTLSLYQDPSLTAIAQTSPMSCSSGCSADQGQTLSVATTASLGSGGYSFTWAITAGTAYCSGSASGSATSTYSCTVGALSATETWTITVYVADSNACKYPSPCAGGSTLSFTVSLYKDPSLTAIAETAPVSCSSSCATDQGQTLSVATTASLGSGSYTFTWTVTAGAAYCSGSATGSPTSTYTCTITSLSATETWTITVYVADSNGCDYPSACTGGSTLSFTETLYQGPALSAITQTSPVSCSSGCSADQGQTLSVATTASLGSGGYTFTWAITAGSAYCSGSASGLTTSTYSCTVGALSATESWTITVYVVDSNGCKYPNPCTGGSTLSITVTLYKDPTLTAVAQTSPLSCSSGCSADQGQTISVDTTASLGSGGYTFTWTVTAGSAYCSGSASGSTTSTYSCTVGALSATETWTVTVYVADSNACEYPSSCTGGSPLSFSDTLYQDPSLTALAETSPVACSSVCSADQGQTLSVATTASLGSGGYSFTWAITAGSSYCSGSASGSTTSTYTCTVGTVSSTQTWTITVYVADSNTCKYPSPCNGGTTLSISMNLYQDPTLTAIAETSPISCSAGCSADQGQTLSVSSTASLGSGGYTFTWAITAGSAYCTSSSTSSTYSCTVKTLSATETWTITVYVADSNACRYPSPCTGGTTLSFTVTLYQDPSLTAVTETAPVTCSSGCSADQGQTLSVATTASLGSGGYSYNWAITAGSSYCSGSSSGSPTSTYSCTVGTLSATQTWTVTVYVADSNGCTYPSSCGGGSTLSISVTLYQDPSLTAVAETSPVSCSSECSADQGQTLTVSSTASLGSGGYFFTWAITAGATYCSSTSTTSTYSCTVGALPATESWTITVYVVDSNGCKYPSPCAGGSSLQITVTLYQDPSLTAIAQSSPIPCSSGCSADQGQTLSVGTSATLGSGVYTFSWAITAGSAYCSSASTTSTLSCTVGTLLATETWTATVFVTDSNGCKYPGPCAGGSTLSFTVTLYRDPQLTDIAQTSPVSCTLSCSADQGQTLSMVTTASLGTGTYSFTWTITSGTAYCPGSATGSTTSTYSCTVGTLPGTQTWTITVYVADSNGCQYPSPCSGGTSLSFTATLYQDPLLSAVAETSPISCSSGCAADQGQTLSVDSTASLGSGGYSFTWTITTGAAFCSGSASGSPMSTYSCSVGTLLVPETWTIEAKVKDSNGVVNVSTSTTVTLNPDPNALQYPSSAQTNESGQVNRFTVNVTLGTAPYTYQWMVNGTAVSGATSAVFDFHPVNPANYTINVTVFDTVGWQLWTPGVVETTTPGPQVALVPPTPSMDMGQTVVFTGIDSGGVAPYTFTWYLNDTVVQVGQPVRWTFTPTGAATYNITLRMTDSENAYVNSTTLRYTVYPDPLVSTPTATPLSIDLGQKLTFTTVASLGSGGYRYAWFGLPAGCSGNTSTVTCTPATAGKFTISVKVTDSNSVTAESGLLSFQVYDDPTITAPTANKTWDYQGQSVTFNSTSAGGSGGNAYVWVGLPTGCQSVDSLKVVCVPTASGTFTITVKITDSSNYNVTSKTLTYVIHPNTWIAITGFAANPATISLGSTTMFHLEVVGGTMPFSYLYTALPLGCTSISSNFLNCTPLAPGNYTVVVTVVDHDGRTARATTGLTVVGTIKPLTVALGTNTTVVVAGAYVYLSAVAEGGISPYIYIWSIDGTNLTGGNQTAYLNETLQDVGSYSFRVWVIDLRGIAVESNNLTIKVVASTATTSSQSLLVWWLLLLLVALVIGVMVFVLEYRRRSRQRKKEPVVTDSTVIVSPSVTVVSMGPTMPEGYYAGLQSPPAHAEWDESDEESAYGTYHISEEDRALIVEDVLPKKAEPTSEAAPQPAAKENVDLLRPWSLKITPEGIKVEDVGASMAPAGAAAAASGLHPTGEAPAAGPEEEEHRPVTTGEHAYKVLMSLESKPNSLEGIEEDVPLAEVELLALLTAFTRAKMVAPAVTKTGEKVYILTPLGRKLGNRFTAARSNRTTEETPETTAAQAGKRPGGKKPPVVGKFYVRKPSTTEPAAPAPEPTPPVSSEAAVPQSHPDVHIESRGVEPDRVQEPPPESPAKPASPPPSVQQDSDARAKNLMDRANEARRKRKGSTEGEESTNPWDEDDH